MPHFCTVGAGIVCSVGVLVSKISASELSRMLIKSAYCWLGGGGGTLSCTLDGKINFLLFWEPNKKKEGDRIGDRLRVPPSVVRNGFGGARRSTFYAVQSCHEGGYTKNPFPSQASLYSLNCTTVRGKFRQLCTYVLQMSNLVKKKKLPPCLVILNASVHPPAATLVV